MKKEKILVTGACGYIGRHVIDALLSQGHSVIAADIVDRGIDDRCEKYIGDIFQDDEMLYEKLHRPDVCLHLAWKDGFHHNSDYHMGHVSDHFQFLCRIHDQGCKHLAVLGSMHEIGYFEGKIDAHTKGNPSSMYGIAKLALRQACELKFGSQDDLVFQWLRAYYIYGDDRHNQSIFTKLILAEATGNVFFPFTTGKNQYDFIHIDDLAKQLAAAVTQKDVQGIIECCSGKPVSLADKVEDFIRQHHYSIKLAYGAFPDRPYDSPIVYGDATKINKILNKQ